MSVASVQDYSSPLLLNKASLACKHVSVPVTALQCIELDQKRFILCGEGCMIKVLSYDGTVHLQSSVFPDSVVIHGFRPSNNVTSKDDIVFIVYGQRVFKILELSCKHNNNNMISLCELSVLHFEEDWILDIHWISQHYKEFKLAIMFAHNRVVIFDSLKYTRYIIRSEVNCILYSAKMNYIESTKELIIVSGSVFNDILISSCSLSLLTTQPLPVSLFLKGHEGVIFGMSFSKCGNHLVSVSDDRTIRTWRIPEEWQEMRGCVISCSNVFYGHASRVWSAEWLSSSLIVSIGEDATARLWNTSCDMSCDSDKCIHVETGHLGGNIWSMAVDRDNRIVITGGGDGGIRKFSYETQSALPVLTPLVLSLPMNTMSHTTAAMSPRVLCLANGVLLCLTDTGSILGINIHNDIISPNNWTLFDNDNVHYYNYSILSLSNTSPLLLAVGGLNGHIKIIYTSNNKVQYQFKPHNGKVYSLTWLTQAPSTLSNLLISCGPNGNMACWSVSINNNYSIISVQSVWLLQLPLSKHRWITSGVYLSLDSSLDPVTISSDPSLMIDQNMKSFPDPVKPSCIVCGDRKGSIHVYILDPLREEDQQETSHVLPVQSYNGIHGSNGVTSINFWSGCVYTTGRDGYCRQFVVKYMKEGVVKAGWKMEYINRFHPLKGINWINNITFTQYNGLITHAFHGNEFILHSSHRDKPLLTVSCGGGHRSSVVCSPTESPLSGREIVSLCNIGQDHEGSLLMAVGSEDCSIALVSCSSKSTTFTVIKRLNEHISVVKALCCINSNDEKCMLLFSGGGRASLKAWTIYTDIPGVPVRLCCEYNLHNLPSRPQRRVKRLTEVPPECRIMSLVCFRCCDVMNNDILLYYGQQVCVVAGCSDGIIRIYVYCGLEMIFTPIKIIDYHKRCILTVKHVICHVTKPASHMTTIPILCTCATDGDIILWNTRCLLEQKQEKTHSNTLEETHSNTTSNTLEETHSSSLEETRSNTSNRTDSNTTEGTCSDSNTTEWTRSDSNTTEGTHSDSHPLYCITEAHQSGINNIAIQTTPLSDNSSSLIIASVGDDNSLMIHYCIIEIVSIKSVVVKCLNKVGVANAHYSTITGVSFLSSSLLITSSVDQRMAVWCIETMQDCNNETGTGTGTGTRAWTETGTRTEARTGTESRAGPGAIVKLSCHKHNIVDVSSLLTYHIRDDTFGIIMGGVGMEHIIIITSFK